MSSLNLKKKHIRIHTHTHIITYYIDNTKESPKILQPGHENQNNVTGALSVPVPLHRDCNRIILGDAIYLKCVNRNVMHDLSGKADD